MPHEITDNLSARERKNAWLQRRDVRMQKIHAEEMDRALNHMNSTKHFLPSQLRALNLEQLVTMACALDSQTHRDADKALIRKEVCRRARKRKVDKADDFRIAYDALCAEVNAHEAKAEMDRHLSNIKLLRNTLGSVETGIAKLEEDAPKVGDTISETEFFSTANDLYTFLFSDVPSYFRVKVWTKDLVRKFHDGLLKMKEMIASIIEDRDIIGEPYGPPEHKSSDPGDNVHVRDLASIKVRKNMFGI